MEWFFAIIIVLGIFTLFGWKGIYAVARLLGFIGAAIIVFVGGFLILSFLGMDISEPSTWFFIGILVLLGILGSLLNSEPTEEELKKREEIYAKIRERLKYK